MADVVTIVPVSSSWTITRGVVSEGVDTVAVGAASREYRCTACGERGHNARTCGQTDTETDLVPRRSSS